MSPFPKLRMTFTNFGRGDAKVVEHPDAIKTYLVRQESVNLDLTKLAKLRWIENLKTPALCGVFGRRRTAIRQSIRTLRKCGISELKLTPEEQKAFREQMEREEKSYGGLYV